MPPATIALDNPFLVSRLCEKCTGISENWAELLDTDGLDDVGAISSRKSFMHHYSTLSNLESSAKLGCALCIHLLKSMDGQDTRIGLDDLYDDEDGRMRMVRHGKHAFILDIDVRNDQTNTHTDISPVDDPLDYTVNRDHLYRLGVINLQIVIMPISASFNLARPPFFDLRMSRNTQDAIPLIRTWLRNCQEDHHLCRILNANFLPTRLILVDAHPPKLILSSKVKASSYATLSHCWGRSQFTTLKIANLADFQNCIPDAALSQTFRDSIIVAREVGLRYIWIDSLCIIQDSPEDWENESVTMSDVYSNSALNISATSASDGTFGLFLERKPTSLCQFLRPGKAMELYNCAPKYAYKQAFTMAPLLKRGWTLQERLLPPRSVHFTTTQTFWECHTTIACENLPYGVPSLMEDADEIGFYDKKPFTRDLWVWAIETYSKAQITVESDKLVAVAGLARKIHDQTGVKYLAGLWEDDLVSALLWTTRPNNDQSDTRPGFYLAPSWSWASSSGAVKFWTDKTSSTSIECIKIISATLEPPNSFAQVTGGTVELQSRFLAARTLDQDGDMALGGKWKYMSFYANLDHKQQEREVYAFMLPICFYFDMIFPTYAHAIGLLLCATGKKKGQYSRIGIFNMWERKEKIVNDVKFSQPWLFFDHQANRANSADCTRRIDEGGEMAYVIEIV